MIYEKPEPIADYEDTREVPGRMAADGTVVRELDGAAARAAVADLRDRGVEALTVSLMNSFASPDHEREVALCRARDLAEPATGLTVLRHRLPTKARPVAHHDERLRHAIVQLRSSNPRPTRLLRIDQLARKRRRIARDRRAC